MHRCRIPSAHTHTHAQAGAWPTRSQRLSQAWARELPPPPTRGKARQGPTRPPKREAPPTLWAGGPLTRQAGLEPQQEQRAVPAPLTLSTVLGPRSSRVAPPASGTERTTAPALTTSIKTQDTVGRPQTARRRPEQRGYAARLDSSGEKYINFMLSNIIVIHLFSRQSF